jgi:hypothetical protein
MISSLVMCSSWGQELDRLSVLLVELMLLAMLLASLSEYKWVDSAKYSRRSSSVQSESHSLTSRREVG